jgi:hypothetical protein
VFGGIGPSHTHHSIKDPPMSFNPGDQLRGYKRMRELAQQDQAKAEVVAKELLDSLSRSVTPVDRVMAKAVAAAIVKLDRTLACGKDTGIARRALKEALAGSPFEPEPAREAAQ